MKTTKIPLHIGHRAPTAQAERASAGHPPDRSLVFGALWFIHSPARKLRE